MEEMRKDLHTLVQTHSLEAVVALAVKVLQEVA
jgi:hypothetical protein